MPVNVYISFQASDLKVVDELETAMAPLVTSGLVRIWHRGKLRAGEFVEETTKRELGAGKIFMLVGSPDALADKAVQWEWQFAVDRMKANVAKAMAVQARVCLMDMSPAADLKLFPEDDAPLQGHPSRDKAVKQIVREVAAMAKG